jgi:sec-independent protein translocase protein TatB
MNIFGVGPLEILLVSVIAIVVLGPERFPQAAVQVARAIKFLRGYANDATSDLREEFKQLTEEYDQLRVELDDIRGSVRKSTSSVTGEVSKVITETRPALKAPDLKQVLDVSTPIIEPGGELPPDRNGSNGSQA